MDKMTRSCDAISIPPGQVQFITLHKTGDLFTSLLPHSYSAICWLRALATTEVATPVVGSRQWLVVLWFFKLHLSILVPYCCGWATPRIICSFCCHILPHVVPTGLSDGTYDFFWGKLLLVGTLQLSQSGLCKRWKRIQRKKNGHHLTIVTFS